MPLINATKIWRFGLCFDKMNPGIPFGIPSVLYETPGDTSRVLSIQGPCSIECVSF